MFFMLLAYSAGMEFSRLHNILQADFKLPEKVENSKEICTEYRLDTAHYM